MLLVDDINDLQLQIKEWSDSDNRAKKYLLPRIGAAGCIPLELLILTLTPIQLVASIGGNVLKGGVKLIRLAAPNSPALKKCDEALPGPIDFWNSLKKTASIAAGFFISLFVGIFHPMTSYNIHKKLNLVEEPKKVEEEKEIPIPPKEEPPLPPKPAIPPKDEPQPPPPPKPSALSNNQQPQPPLPPKPSIPPIKPSPAPIIVVDPPRPSSPVKDQSHDHNKLPPELPKNPPPLDPPKFKADDSIKGKTTKHKHHHHKKKSSKHKHEHDPLADVKEPTPPRKVKLHSGSQKMTRHRSAGHLNKEKTLHVGDIIGQTPFVAESSDIHKNIQNLNITVEAEPPKSEERKSHRFSLTLPKSVSKFFKRQPEDEPASSVRFTRDKKAE